MSAKLHLICRDRLGIDAVDPQTHTYVSQAWLLSNEEAAALVGGTVLFHQTKSEASYFGGTVQSVDPVGPVAGDEEFAGRQRFKILLVSNSSARGVEWDKRGRSHSMAWSSGVLVGSQVEGSDLEGDPEEGQQEPYQKVGDASYFRDVLGNMSKAKRQDGLSGKSVRFGRLGSGHAPHYQVHFDDGSVKRFSGLSHGQYHEAPYESFESDHLSPGEFTQADVQALIAKRL